MLKNQFRFAWRSLWKNRRINWINIAGLSAGMTSAILIFLWVQNETSYDAYHPGADRIYRITSNITSAKWKWATAPLPLADAMTAELPQVEKTAAVQSAYGIYFHIGDEFFEEKDAAHVGKDWFDLFHYDFIEGTAATFLQHPFSLALTESKAKKYFGNRSAIGQKIRIDSADYEVRAVVKDNPSNSSFQYDVLIPLDAWLADPGQRKNDMTWNNYNYLVFLKLRPGANTVQTAKKITDLVNRSQKEPGTVIDLEPLRQMHFETDLTSSGTAVIDHRTVYIFSILGIFLLVIASINYVNLTTARASLRAKEISIRKIVGADKKGLFIQFILESFLISLVSLLITVLLVRLSIPVFNELTGKHFTDPLTSPGMWKIVGFTVLAATALNGIYPAILLSSFNPLNVFKGSSILKFKDVYLRKGLVVLQFTFSIILIISTIIIQRQLNYIHTTNPGYNRSQVFSFRLPWTLFRHKTNEEKASTLNSIKHELLSRTGISGVSIASQSIVHLSSSNSGSADWEGHDSSFKPTVYQLSADEDYQQVFQIKMKEGRWFRPENTTDLHNFILNETAVNDLKMRKPVLGQRFSFQGDTGTVIGIVKDFHYASLHDRIAPLVLFNRNGWRSTFYIKTQEGKTAQALATARSLSQQYNPGKPFDYSFLDDEFNKLYQADTKLSRLILVFSIIAIVISCMGLFGLAAFASEQRVKEIGIRKVLGATVTNILTLLSKDFIRLVVLSILIATPIAGWAMHKWLQDFAYHIPVSVDIFVLAGILAVLIALTTISFQAIKAALSNPVKSLRTE
ncbi:MAG TPA: ABC transporter permease [Puia sp.]|nr:ABC transporter permease [Puia sp.]